MIIYKQSTDINQFLISQHRQGKKIGFVPTMGALHEGHLSLIEESKKLNQMTVCSIFINPRQFNNPNDLLHYPVTIDQDIQKLEEHGCDILFLPAISDIYPEDFQPKHYDLGYLETVLEGKYRPGHFQGVCAVVEQLLKICTSHTLYLGKKDYQQCLVIKRLCEINECDVQIVLNVNLSVGIELNSDKASDECCVLNSSVWSASLNKKPCGQCLAHGELF